MQVSILQLNNLVKFNATKNRMSKRGTPYLRRALWTASIVAAFNDPNLHEYYLKKKNEGKHHGTIIGAIARKLIYRIFIVLKDNIPYQCINAKHNPMIYNVIFYTKL
mgnify:CR=1 FL=1